jgi:mono/diheme cytochrome c family protein
MDEPIEVDGEEYNNVMASHAFLKDQEIADVLNYVRNSFGNKASGITPAEVKAVRSTVK